LSRFLAPQTIEEFHRSDAWEVALGEPPQRAIERLVPTSLQEWLTGTVAGSGLEHMEDEGDLPLSSSQDGLTARQMKMDPVKTAPVSLQIWRCSKQGRRLARRYLTAEAHRRATVEQGVLNALRRPDFSCAVQFVVSFEAEQVFPRGFEVGISAYDYWQHHDAAGDIAALTTIFERKLSFFNRLTNEQIEQVRLVAGIAYLWDADRAGEWLPPDLQREAGVTPDVVAQLIAEFVPD